MAVTGVAKHRTAVPDYPPTMAYDQISLAAPMMPILVSCLLFKLCINGNDTICVAAVYTFIIHAIKYYRIELIRISQSTVVNILCTCWSKAGNLVYAPLFGHVKQSKKG